MSKIALVTGGYSGESVISYKSAACVAEQLDIQKWDYHVIDIRTDGWFYKDETGIECSVDKNDFSIFFRVGRIGMYTNKQIAFCLIGNLCFFHYCVKNIGSSC